MATISELMATLRAEREALNGLQQRLSHASSYTERNALMARIRHAEDTIVALTTAIQRAQTTKVYPVTVFGTKKRPSIRQGLSCTMDISTDGFYFSNPAPKIANGQRVWVRLRIAVAQASPFATVRTEIPEMIRCTWVIPKGWKRLDNYSNAGRVERFVSNPLTVTREFKAPSSGTTKAKFGCFVDPYHYVEELAELPPETAPIETTTVTATLEPGAYRFYTRTSNVLSSYTTETFPSGTSFIVDDTDDALFYTDGNTYLLVRNILSGPYGGKYIVIAQEGITLTEIEDADTTDTSEG